MATLGTLRQTRIEDLQTVIRHLQNKMATFVATRTTDEDEYLQNWGPWPRCRRRCRS